MLIKTEQAMLSYGARLSQQLNPGDIVALKGELGAGKTTLVKGILQGLGYTGYVKSPTYTIVESYSFHQLTVYHFDFYRIHDALELEAMGIRDYFNHNTMALIEWPELGGSIIPHPTMTCQILIQSTTRELLITK